MFKRQEYANLVKKFMEVLTKQFQRVLNNPYEVDLYFKPEETMIELMMMSYRDGYNNGRDEVLSKIEEFDDTTNDPIEN